MNIFEGLYIYEIAMLVGGCLLFLASLVGLVLCLAKDKSTTGLYPLFVLAVVMIGFPAYTKIQISKDGVELDKNTHELLTHPTDRQLRDTVSAEASRLAARPIQNPTILTTVARAQIALGNNQAAQNNVDKALQASPKNIAALELSNRLGLDKDLVVLVAEVEQHPGDTAAKAKLAQVVAQLGNTTIASPVTITNLAKAHALLGNQAEAKKNVVKALQIDPKSPQALELRQRLGPA